MNENTILLKMQFWKQIGKLVSSQFLSKQLVLRHIIHSKFDRCRPFTNYEQQLYLMPIPRTFHARNQKIDNRPLLLSLTSLLSIFGFSTLEDEKIDSALIDTLKRSKLMIENGDFKKAEIALHLALNLAKKQFNQNGIIYTYDVMANLAYDQKDFAKAHTLFVTIMQMLIAKGIDQSDPKMIHISLKLAKIYEHFKRFDAAKIGYDWCFEAIDKHKEIDDDLKILKSLAHDWYADYLLKMNKLEDSLQNLQKCYELLKEVRGEHSVEMMIILNDIGSIYFKLKKYEESERYLKKAKIICQLIENEEFLDVIDANLGVVSLYNGNKSLATKLCQSAKMNALQKHNEDALNQANFCLTEINDFKTN